MRLPILTLLAALAAGTARAEDIASGEWQVLALDGARFAACASLALDAAGRISGKAPCNRYFGQNGAALPALSLKNLGATKMACDAMAEEDRYFNALQAMTMAALQDGHLILTGPDSGPEGRSLELVRDPGDKALVCLTCQN